MDKYEDKYKDKYEDKYTDKGKLIKFYNTKPDLLVSKSFALVGNSDNLLKNRYGAEIDQYIDVLRFNYGDLKKDITGLKTTIRWINCPIDIPSSKEHNKDIKTMSDVKKYTSRLFSNTNIICWKNLQEKMININKEFKFFTPNEMCVFGTINSYLDMLGVKHRFDVVPNCWPRTGFQAVLTCIRSGIVPHIYGFDIDQKKIIKHYSLNTNYDVSKIKEHQVDNEIVVLREFEEKGLIVVHR